MTIESLRKDENELVMHFANSWNCTEVFLNNVVYGAMECVDDVRCDSNIFCPTSGTMRREGNGETLQILDDLKKSESRQEPPSSPTQEMALAAMSSAIKQKYSVDSINSILVDSFDELDDLKLSLDDCEAFDEQSLKVFSDVTEKVDNKTEDTAISVEQASSTAAEDGQEQKVTTVEAENCDCPGGGVKTTSVPLPITQSLSPPVVTLTSTAVASEEVVAETEVVLANFLKAERELEEILQVNGEIKYEDVVSLIDNSFLPSEAVAKAVNGVENPYFDDNATENQEGTEKFRCSFLPFFC